MLSNLLIFLSIIFFIWLAHYHWKRRRLYLLAAKHKGPTPLPIIGNALSFIGSNTDLLRNSMDIMAKYKSPIPVWLGQQLFFFVTDAKQLKVILNHPNALQKEDLYKYAVPWLGLGLFTAPVFQWKRHRRMITPTFNQKILNGFVEVFSEQAIVLVNQLEKVAGTGKFDVLRYFSLFALDAICDTAMGISINAQTTDAKFARWIDRAMKISFTRIFDYWYHFDFIFDNFMTSMAEEFKDICTKIRTFTGDVVTQKRIKFEQQKMQDNSETQWEEVPRKKKSFLQQFMELSEAEVHLTNTEIIDEVLALLVGGSETSASINSFTLIMLGMHPDIQEKVYREVIDALGNDKPVECTDLPNLPYTEMVIRETMRIFPVGPLLARSITGDIQLDENTVIPAGSSVVIGAIYAQRNPDVWPNPLQFDPLRFSPEECAKRHPYNFLPFSGGLRNCIGLKFAMMAMKTVIATVVRKYHITKSIYEKIEDIKIKQHVILKPVDGYGIFIEARN